MEFEQLVTDTNELDDLLLNEECKSSSSNSSRGEEELHDDYTAVQIPDEPYSVDDDPMLLGDLYPSNGQMPPRKLSSEAYGSKGEGHHVKTERQSIRKASGGQFL